MPDFTFENSCDGSVCGIDEAGRGPLAGPVVAAAVLLPEGFPEDILVRLDDSKKLSAKKREALDIEIREHAAFGVGIASVEEIDDVNILQATFIAMRRAYEELSKKLGEDCDFALIDGNKKPDLRSISSQAIEKTIIKGDSLSFSIAAASIIAKTYRDSIMFDLHQKHPQYGWANNAGYGTKAHIETIKNIGITRHHRHSFKPICELFATEY